MARAFIERHIRALSLAQACMQLGARMRTTALVTGLSNADLSKLYQPGDRIFRAGRPPASQHWLMDKTNCAMRAELSVFAAIFARITEHGFAPGEALVAAYKLYASTCTGHPRVSFDRAFDLACHLKGMWAHHTVNVALYPCPHCGSLYIASIGDHTTRHHGCVFCRLLERYNKARRIQAGCPGRRGSGPALPAQGKSSLPADAEIASIFAPILAG